MVLQGRPRKVLCLYWFYKVVRDNCCFYMGFTRLSAKSCVLYWFHKVVRGQPARAQNRPRSSSRRRRRSDKTCPQQPQHHNLIASRSPTQLRLASLARSHARNETISRLVSQRTHLPNLQYVIYTMHSCAHTCVCVYAMCIGMCTLYSMNRLFGEFFNNFGRVF